MKLKVNEIFYSLQGEGGRNGEASIFIRLSGCNLNCDFCDTSFDSGENLSPDEIFSRISEFPCHWIVWTGGEPTLQLTDEILVYFKDKGYKQAIESNGLLPLSGILDYTVCSPKGNHLGYAKRTNPSVSEIRLAIKAGEVIPDIKTFSQAKFYFLSPVFDPDETITRQNIAYCVEQVKSHPQWRLSVQIHKLIHIP